MVYKVGIVSVFWLGSGNPHPNLLFTMFYARITGLYTHNFDLAFFNIRNEIIRDPVQIKEHVLLHLTIFMKFWILALL